MQGPVVVPPSQFPLKRFAMAQIVIGIVAALLGIISKSALPDGNWSANIGTGIWTGAWIIITGIIGIRSIRNTMNVYGNFTTYMVFNIISTCVSFVAGVFFANGVIFNGHRYHCYHIGPECHYIDNTAALALFISLLILMIVNFLLSIVSAAYCCQCCRGYTYGHVGMQQPAIITTTGQVIPMNTPHQISYSQYPLQHVNMMQYPPQQPNVSQNLTQQPNAAQQANVVQYAPQQQQPNAAQQANVVQYTPQQQQPNTAQQANVVQYTPQQLNVSQNLTQQPNAAQKANATDNRAQASNVAQQQTNIVYPDKPPEYSTQG